MTKSLLSKLDHKLRLCRDFLSSSTTFTPSNSTFYGDNSATRQHVEFLSDSKFLASRDFTFQDAPYDIVKSIRQTNIDWRIHIVTWAATRCMQLDGDFVECGVWWGWLSRAICHYTNFESSPKRFFLYDTWGAEGSHANYQEDIFDFVKYRFQDYSNVSFHRGMVPAVLEHIDSPSKISYLSLDMNGGIAERMALDFLYHKVVSGGIIYIDDYGWDYPRLRSELSDFLSDKPDQLLHFPCGSSIIVKV